MKNNESRSGFYAVGTLDCRNILLIVATMAIPSFVRSRQSANESSAGPATSAQLESPIGVTIEAAGNLYIADDNRIRKVSAVGVISTVAGNGRGGFSGDHEPATSASIFDPLGLAVDGAGNLYIGESDRSRP